MSNNNKKASEIHPAIIANRNHIQESSLPPKITSTMYKGMSDYRKGTLNAEVEAGLYRDGSSRNENQTTALGNVASLRTKTANSTLGTVSGQWRGGLGDNLTQVPELYSPLWLTSNLNLPRDRFTINSWCRAFFTLSPIVHNAINLHSTYPISKLNIKCANKEVENFFNEMIEEIDLMNICVQIAQEYWLLGEAFPYAELDEHKGKWSRIVLQNPDYMLVKPSVVSGEPIIMMKPDQNLKNIVSGNRPSDRAQRQMLNETIIEHVKRGENIPLDNFNITHLAMKTSPYEIRGTGLPVCVFRELMLFQKLRESKYVQSEDMINPLTIIKIGSENYKPTIGDIEMWRNTFEEASGNKNFKIFTHEGVAVERVGANAGIYDISGDITQLLKEIYSGLMVPPVVMDGGADTSYANGGVALDVLRNRYQSFRQMLTTFLRRKIFAPISKINEFYDTVNGKKVLIVPDVDWNHMSLFDAGDYIQTLTGMLKDKEISTQTVYKSLGVEWEEEQRKLRKERIADAISAKETENLKKMPLNELRALSDDSEIPEITESALPGENFEEENTEAPAGSKDEEPSLPSLPGT